MDHTNGASPAPTAAEDIIIYYDDLTDSDNWTAARWLQYAADKAAKKTPPPRVIWIVEPRLMALGYSMTKEQISGCTELIKKHFPDRGLAFRVLLGGRLTEEDIAGVEGLNETERNLLRFAIKPKKGLAEIGDSVLHGRLSAFDLSASLTAWSKKPVDVFLDIHSLNTMTNPVNDHMHYHEELVGRNKQELEEYDEIMKQPDHSERVKNLREWYEGCIKRLEEDAAPVGGNTVRDLSLAEFNKLCDVVVNARSVRFFGGSSLRILQRFIEKGVAGNMECYMQAGMFPGTPVLFHNQFNVALDPKAAKEVFQRHDEFKRFVVMPSHTTQNVKFSVTGLTFGAETLVKRILGFNCRIDALEAMKMEEDDKDAPSNYIAGKIFTMPDLAALICAFFPGFEKTYIDRATLDEKKDGMLLFEHIDKQPDDLESRDSAAGIRVCVFPKGAPVVELDDTRIRQLMDSLDVQGPCL